MEKRLLLLSVLALTMLSCTNASNKEQKSQEGDKQVTSLLDKDNADASATTSTDGIGIPLPAPFEPGPLDYIPDAENDEEVVLTMANLGFWDNVESMKKGPFWKLFCSLYPQIESINKLTVDNGEGCIWLIVPWEENTSLAINEYNMEMFLGNQSTDDGQVYYRTEQAEPILIRTSMDDPGSVLINAVTNSGVTMGWLPTQEPSTNNLRDQNGVGIITYDPLFYFVHYGPYYNADYNGEDINLRFFADRQLFFNGHMGHYFCYDTADGEQGLYMKCGDMECFGFINGKVEDEKFTLTVKEGSINGAGKGTKLTFECSEGV